MKKTINVVGAVIINDNKVLCVQRGSAKSLPFKWEFPGGKIEQGESPQEALKREILEELNCEIDIEKEVTHTVYEYDFGVVRLTTFYCSIQNGFPELMEHHAMKWLRPEELLTIDWASADIPAVEKIMKEGTP